MMYQIHAESVSHLVIVILPMGVNANFNIEQL